MVGIIGHRAGFYCIAEEASLPADLIRFATKYPQPEEEVPRAPSAGPLGRRPPGKQSKSLVRVHSECIVAIPYFRLPAGAAGPREVAGGPVITALYMAIPRARRLSGRGRRRDAPGPSKRPQPPGRTTESWPQTSMGRLL
jgi:hypothetical protein